MATIAASVGKRKSSVFWLNLPWAKIAAHLPGVGA